MLIGTRVALGAGIGLLISDRLNKDQRKGAGGALFAIGVLSNQSLKIDNGNLAGSRSGSSRRLCKSGGAKQQSKYNN